ncbi:MAG TPA: phytoene/squalene synthase family protein [Spirochaetota bacterium]|nr:phytoene/squalene synthase family protein [Spirochaetota bacterium]
MKKNAEDIFRKGSKTYFYSSIFFPEKIRTRVFTLYAFVRTADDFVDSVPQNAAGFYAFRDAYRKATEGIPSGNPVIDDFVMLEGECGFRHEWTESFFNSMELDLSKKNYDAMNETLEYIYGSAEVIGLYMCSLMGLDPQSHKSAVMLGRAMQMINFIRDIDEDNGLGRRYLPLTGCTLKSLTQAEAENNRKEFDRFIRDQIKIYLEWQREAEAGYHYIPFRYRVPIQTAAKMYKWTASVICKHPTIVYRKKVKPSKLRIFATFTACFAFGWLK